jgi:hypothetical protein
MPVVLGEAAEVLGVSVKELKRQSLKALLEKELRSLRVEILSICQKYGVDSWEGMNKLIVKDKVEEGKILDDFQRVDHLTAKTKRIQALLERA